MSRAERPGVITLARHGRPHADRTVRINADGYRDWWANYDVVRLHPDETPPADAIDAARGAQILWSSSLPRAIATAEAVAPGRDIAIDPLFVEAPLPPPPLPRFVAFKPPTWGVLSRIVWWLGYSAGGESRAQAERRAEEAVRKLVAAAAEGRNVMAVAHGWFNRMMRPHLERHGYQCVQDGGDGYWSFRVYEPAPGAFTLPPPADKLTQKGE